MLQKDQIFRCLLLDFAGPFSIKAFNLQNAIIVNGYRTVCVCFSIRAAHHRSFKRRLTSINRFTGRIGFPRTLFSDDGRNFLGAILTLLKAYNEFLKTAENALAKKYSAHRFKWSLIPPYAPHMGGKNSLQCWSELKQYIIHDHCHHWPKPNRIVAFDSKSFLLGAPMIAPSEADE